jgi:hypothetical protein
MLVHRAHAPGPVLLMHRAAFASRWPAGRADSERYVNMASDCSPGIGGNIILADGLFGENGRANGVLADEPGVNAGCEHSGRAARSRGYHREYVLIAR